jgi:hypothetical protein
MTEEGMMISWVAVRVKPQQEFNAQEQLTQDGFHVYVPFTTERRRLLRHARKIYGWHKMPVLPGLIFVAFPGPADGTTLDDIRSWPNVSKVMGNPTDSGEPGGYAKPVSGAVIDRIRALEVKARSIKENPDWKPSEGQRVKVTSEDHPLYGMTLIVARVIGRKAKKFWADMGGRLVMIETRNVVAA